jgi:hypothetical protein
LVVIFLKRNPWFIKVARLGALWPIRETGDDGRRSIGLPLLLTVGVGSSTCCNKRGKLPIELKLTKRPSIGK